MKKIVFFSFLVFLFILGCSKSDEIAVNPNENQLKSGIIERNYPMETTGKFIIPVICDDVEIDRLTGTLEIWCRMFGYYDSTGKFIGQWRVQTFEGTLTSTSGSGEVFNVKGSRKIDNINTEFTLRANITGSKGSHYILSGSSESLPPNGLIIDKATCPSGPPDEN
jgi:hypothetical protein